MIVSIISVLTTLMGLVFGFIGTSDIVDGLLARSTFGNPSEPANTFLRHGNVKLKIGLILSIIGLLIPQIYDIFSK